MRATFNGAGKRIALRLGVLASLAVAIGLGLATPAQADYGWRGPHHRHHGGYGYYGYRRPPPVYRYVPPPPVYYAPAPVYRYVPPPPVYYAPPSIGFGVTIY